VKTKIHFIVNPVAGSGDNELSMSYLNTFFEGDFYEITVKESLYPKHSIELCKESISEKANIIVACGGDGTINEIASSLVHSNVILGIIPMGSGNGLASNLKIPVNVKKALQIIRNYNVIEIDAGTINEELFFSNTGCGFDAHVIADFEKNSKRKLWSYIRSVLRSFRTYNYPNTFELQYSNEKKSLNPFLIFISNSNEMGYNMSLTPTASLQDGLLDVILVPKLSLLKMISFTFLFFIKKHYWLEEVELIKVDSIALFRQSGNVIKVQKDGESMELNSDIIKVKLLAKALKVCVN